MTILRKGLLGLIVATAALVVAGPVIVISAVLAALVGVFALAVCIWAFVLLGERWVDEGLDSYGYLDALDEALDDVFHGIAITILSLRPTSIRKRASKIAAAFVAALPLAKERARVIAVLPIFPFIVLLGVIVEGYRVVRKDLVGTGQSIKDHWAGAYL